MFHIDEPITPNTYQEVNLDKYKFLSDEDNPGGFDERASLFTNANGEAILTSGGADANIADTDLFGNYYDFDKKEFTEAGINFYSKKFGGDQEKIDKHLANVEAELKGALLDDYQKRKKTDENAVLNDLVATPDVDSVNDGGGGGSNSADNASIQNMLEENYTGLHSTDSFLQRLSLKNLKYPIDADYGNTQDYNQINQFTYKSTSEEILFPTGENTVFEQFGLTLTQGLKMGSQKEKHIGLVKLPMPNDLTDSNNVAWGEDQLNAITAAAATLTAGGVDSGIKFLEEIASGDKGLLSAAGELLTGGKDAFGKIIAELKNAARGDDAQLLGRSVVGSGILNLAGFGLSPEAILARGAGIIPNSNLQLLFNAPTLRAFRFNWKMSPRSQDEAIRINNIIRFFKQGIAVKRRKGSGAGGRSYFLATPNVFDITFRTSKTNREITNENNAVLRMKTCACVGAAVNYTPQGMWNAYEKGQPTSCILSLQFKELEPVYNTDYEEDPFEYEDLTGFVPENAVGY